MRESLDFKNIIYLLEEIDSLKREDLDEIKWKLKYNFVYSNSIGCSGHLEIKQNLMMFSMCNGLCYKMRIDKNVNKN